MNRPSDPYRPTKKGGDVVGEGLVGKRVIVTAGASGIGRVIASRFAAGGARVHVCDVAPEMVEAFRSESRRCWSPSWR